MRVAVHWRFRLLSGLRLCESPLRSAVLALVGLPPPEPCKTAGHGTLHETAAAVPVIAQSADYMLCCLCQTLLFVSGFIVKMQLYADNNVCDKHPVWIVVFDNILLCFVAVGFLHTPFSNR